MPTEKDFQRLVLYTSNNENFSNSLDDQGVVFSQVTEESRPRALEGVSPNKFSPQMASEVQDLVKTSSLTKPRIMARIFEKVANNSSFENMVKNDLSSYPGEAPVIKAKRFIQPPLPVAESPIKNPAIAMSTIGGLYLGYKKLFNSVASANHSTLVELISKYPWLLPLLIGGGAVGSMQAQKELRKHAFFAPYFLPRLLVGVPATYAYSGHQEVKRRRGEELGKVQDFVRKHPFLSSMMALGASGSALKKLSSADAFGKIAYKLNEKDFNNLYNGMIGN
jgi:hypothetical protein